MKKRSRSSLDELCLNTNVFGHNFNADFLSEMRLLLGKIQLMHWLGWLDNFTRLSSGMSPRKIYTSYVMILVFLAIANKNIIIINFLNSIKGKNYFNTYQFKIIKIKPQIFSMLRITACFTSVKKTQNTTYTEFS